MAGTSADVPGWFPNGWWLDGYPMRPAARWVDRSLTLEIGKRAYGCLLIENRLPARKPDNVETLRPELLLASSQ